MACPNCGSVRAYYVEETRMMVAVGEDCSPCVELDDTRCTTVTVVCDKCGRIHSGGAE
jgi:ribosomal protein L37AE/L43A